MRLAYAMMSTAPSFYKWYLIQGNLHPMQIQDPLISVDIVDKYASQLEKKISMIKDFVRERSQKY